MIKILVLASIFTITATQVFAQVVNDTSTTKKSIVVLPVLTYQPETSLAAGLTFAYYLQSKELNRISSIAGSAIYTFKNQFTFNVTPRIFFVNNKWYLYANLSANKYPDYFYGIGSRPTGIKLMFDAYNYKIVLQPQYIVTKNILIGVVVSSQFERVSIDPSNQIFADSLQNQFDITGWKPYTQLNLGLVAAYDSRDNQFYPEKGIFVKTICAFSKKSWGSDYSLNELSVDYRQYYSISKSHIIAWQMNFNSIFGSEGIPFPMLPTLGGSDKLRGFREGMYRDNLMLIGQTEYRFPIYKKLKGAMFCGSGDVFNSANIHLERLKVAYGAGLRYQLNNARVHLRLDVATNNYGDKFQMYITANEAF